MKYSKLLWLLAMALAVPQRLCSQTDGNSHYIYFANGNVKAFPKEYVKELDNDGGRCTITLVNDSTISWNASEITEISDVKPDYPRFTFFELNDKHNDQLVSDVEATITDDRVTASVGGIGKWLTPTFEMDSNDGIAFVGGNRQTSEESRLRFAEPVVYTLSREGHQRLAMERVSNGETTVREISLNKDMLSTNAPTSQEGEGLDMMLDGNTSTFFHSTWSADKVYEVDLNKQVYISVTLPKAVSDIQFHYVGRPGTSKYNIFEWKIEASNDGSSWTEITTINESNGLPTEGNGAAYTSPTISLGAKYSHLRFTAVKVGYKNYLCISELKLYEVTTSNSEYAFRMMPLGRDVTVDIDWLADRAESVPRIDINIDGGQMVSSKEYYLNALIKIQGFGVWPDFEDSVQIKGRGNISWNEDNPYAKNPYRLKFGSSVKPFGMKKGKNWNLIAQAQKGSMMTNVMAMKAARLAGTAAANDIIPVDLYMNGDYRGSYIFTQKVGLANNSVDIDETAAALLELDRYYDETYKFKSAKYALPVNIKEPDFSEGETMLTFGQVQDDFNSFESAVYNNSHFERLIDMEMLTRFMLVNELVLNTELGHPKSIFLYRENINHMSSKYTFGPVWDFDWSFNYEENRTYCTSGATNNILNYQTSRPGCKFFTKLWNSSPWLKHEYGKLWSSFVNNNLQELIDYADDYYAFANQSFKKNATKWSDGANYDSNVANMKQWLRTRALYLSSIYPLPSTATPYTFGDINSDGIIDDTDVQLLANAIVSPDGNANSQLADIDSNGSITASDLAWLCDMANKPSVNLDHRDRPEMAANNLTMGIEQSEAAGTWHLNVGMNNTDPFIALSMKVNLPNGIIVKNSQNGIVANERLAYAHQITAGQNGQTWQLLAYSPANEYFPTTTGGLLTVTITTDETAKKGTYPISITDITAVNGNGIETKLPQTDIALNVTETGINDVTSGPAITTYFTLDGKQLQQPQPGIIICRKLYPDGRVEVKKVNY